MRKTRVLLAFDKFKGSLTADEVARSILSGIVSTHPAAECHIQSVADGGGGTLDLLHDVIRSSVWVEVQNILDPRSRPRSARYLRQKNTAWIEMAEASGIELVYDLPLNALEAHSYGTGQLILHAIRSGCTQIYLLIGGSASTDMGTGALAAMGVQFYDYKDRTIAYPSGQTLQDIARIDAAAIKPLMDKVRIQILCDVQNPLYGSEGAAHVYGEQKGARKEEDRNFLDKGLQHLSQLIKQAYQMDLQKIKGAGAAGGIAAGIKGILGAELVSGTDTILKWLGIEEKVKHTDIIIAGEGKVDHQSLRGKVLSGLIHLAREHGKPVILVAGVIELSEHPAFIEHTYSILSRSINLEDAMQNPEPKLEHIGAQIGEYLLQFKR